MNKLSKIISEIAHPVFIPTYTLLMGLATGLIGYIPLRILIHNIIWIEFITLIIPFFIILLLQSCRIIKSLTMESRKERIISIILMITALTVCLIGIPETNYTYYIIFIIILIITSFAALIITPLWMISLHTLGWGCLCGYCYILSFLSHDTYLPYFIGSILVSGIVSSARLQLKAHTPTQIYAGFVIGFVISLSSAVFLFSYFV